ncbi:MAG: PDC sensor domain-containing protein [Hydrogenophilaceae bacterium]
MPESLQEAITRQRQILKGWLSSSLAILAEGCREVWPARDGLEARLAEGMTELPYCKYLYVLDADAHQITANLSRKGLMPDQFGRDRSQRPYLAEALAGAHFSLSDAYLSRNARRPSLTAVQRILAGDGCLLGFLGADFDLRELPATQDIYRQPGQWMQVKGDPAIRAGLFHQARADSLMDQRIDAVLELMNELMTVHGVFHGKLHFSSSRATLWLINDPYRYRMHGIEELSDPALCMAYPHCPYPDQAVLPAERIRDILQTFKALRFMDETLYLRSGSINIFNGIIGLTFSCDGSHYMPWDEFLDKNIGFWLGTSNAG